MRSGETIILEQCLELLEGKVPLDRWPPKARDAFLAALDQDSGTSPERQKACDLHRHLFRDRTFSSQGATKGSPAAERVRADLIALVSLGAGVYLAERSS